MKKYRFFNTFLKLVSLHVAVNSARKNRSHFGNFEQSFHNYATVKGYQLTYLAHLSFLFFFFSN